MSIEGNFNLKPEAPKREQGNQRIFRIVGLERTNMIASLEAQGMTPDQAEAEVIRREVSATNKLQKAA